MSTTPEKKNRMAVIDNATRLLREARLFCRMYELEAWEVTLEKDAPRESFGETAFGVKHLTSVTDPVGTWRADGQLRGGYLFWPKSGYITEICSSREGAFQVLFDWLSRQREGVESEEQYARAKGAP